MNTSPDLYRRVAAIINNYPAGWFDPVRYAVCEVEMLNYVIARRWKLDLEPHVGGVLCRISERKMLRYWWVKRAEAVGRTRPEAIARAIVSMEDNRHG